jgi:hypothetical protein
MFDSGDDEFIDPIIIYIDDLKTKAIPIKFIRDSRNTSEVRHRKAAYCLATANETISANRLLATLMP